MLIPENRQFNDAQDLIVLIHGFGAIRLVMRPLAYQLRRRGFRVQHWTYVSLFDPIERHAIRFFDFLRTVSATEHRFHIVAHSMGSIVSLSALNRGLFPNLGRLVLLAPPNCGSPVARIASKFVGRIITPTCELSDAEDSYVNRFARTSEIEIGIIAARFDALVPIKNTHLSNEKAHVVVNATHNSLLLSKSVSDLIARFLEHGSFDDSPMSLESRT